MPDKKRQSKARRSSLNKRRREMQGSSDITPITPQPIAAQTSKPATPTGKVAPRPATAPAAAVTVQHPYVGAELLRIGILAGIILAILIALYFFLPRI